MGILDIPFPLFSWVDESLRTVLSPLMLIVFWAVLASIVSMLLYQLFSKQEAIFRVNARASEARRELIRYDGEFPGFLSLTRRTLALSAKQLQLTLGPAVISSVPLASLIAWLSLAYGYGFAVPGSVIEVKTYPQEIAIRWEPAAAPVPGERVWRVAWPAPGQTVRLIEEDGRKVFALPPAAPVPIIHKRRWWNIILGNPIGYLPEEGALDRIEYELPTIVYIDAGPAWLGSWATIFFTVLLLCSLAIKIGFRIK